MRERFIYLARRKSERASEKRWRNISIGVAMAALMLAAMLLWRHFHSL